MTALWQDIRFGLRTLAANKGFTVVAVTVLALGIGANAAVFNLAQAFLLTPAPGVVEPGRVVRIGKTHSGQGFDTASWPNLLDYRERSKSFSDLAAHTDRSFNLTSERGTERLQAGLVSGNYFRMLGVRPHRGNLITPDDALEEGQHPVLVLSFATWQRMFNGDESVIGKSVTVNGKPYSLIGVTPPGFIGTAMSGEELQAWAPIQMIIDFVPFLRDFSLFDVRGASWFHRFGRLAPGVTVEQAQAEMDLIAAQLREEHPKDNENVGIALAAGLGLYPSSQNDVNTALILLGSISGMVLLIACANAANLLLARASQRRKELAVRAALGANRVRLVRLILTEGVLLWLLGGLLGLFLSVWISKALLAVAQNRIDVIEAGAQWNATMLGFGLAVSLITGLLFTLVPALQAARADLAHTLREGGRSTGTASAWLRKGFVVVQIAVTVILLTGAGLLTRTLLSYQSIGIGFNSSNILTVGLDPGLNAYSDDAGKAYFGQFLSRIKALPGVEQAALAITMPLSRSNWGLSFRIDGVLNDKGEENLGGDFNAVTPGYFRMLGVDVIVGREFTAQDTETSEQATVVNQAFVRKWLKDRNAIGEFIKFDDDSKPIRIVGVVRDIKTRSLTSEPRPFFYIPQSQFYVSDQYLHIKTAGPPHGLLPQVRGVVAALDPNIPLTDIRTMDERVTAYLSEESARASFVNTFSLLALLLASVGLYGVMSFAVGQRTHEIGIRMALGAQRAGILAMILRQGLGVTAIGAVVGLAASFALTRFLESMLYGVTATDPLTYAGVTAMLLLTAALACLVPARRAARVEPMIALRYE